VIVKFHNFINRQGPTTGAVKFFVDKTPEGNAGPTAAQQSAPLAYGQ